MWKMRKIDLIYWTNRGIITRVAMCFCGKLAQWYTDFLSIQYPPMQPVAHGNIRCLQIFKGQTLAILNNRTIFVKQNGIRIVRARNHRHFKHLLFHLLSSKNFSWREWESQKPLFTFAMKNWEKTSKKDLRRGDDRDFRQQDQEQKKKKLKPQEKIKYRSRGYYESDSDE